VRVKDRASLESALERAVRGSVVYVEDSATLDFTGGSRSVCIPAGVTLASGRGRGGSAGALVFTTTTSTIPLFRACGSDVRVTGLRIIGADSVRCPPAYSSTSACSGKLCRDCLPTSVGLITAMDRLEVDNCELAGWSLAAVRLEKGSDHHVHHSYLHHNQRDGLGYGVLLSSAPVDALVDHNRFDFNRHSIAGSGFRSQSYEARANLVLPNATQHVYDMHGINEHSGDGSPWAGGRLLIHENVVLPPNVYGVVVRGRPETGAWIYDNCFVRSQAGATLQQYFKGNFFPDQSPAGPAPNQYSQTPDGCQSRRFCVETSARGPWRSLASSTLGLDEVAAHDFDGDGRADLLRATGREWQSRSGGLGAWTTRRASTEVLRDLRFADLDGDGQSDAFAATGSEWRTSRSAREPWATLRASTEPLGALAFGDFDGDRRADVFLATGTEWRFSAGGTKSPTLLRASTEQLALLAFGDFDGDGQTDVFNATGTEWRLSASGRGAWQSLGSSALRIQDLAFADVDGDGRTDVLSRDGARWLLSRGGRPPATLWSVNSLPFTATRFADFDGDRQADALVAGCF
jgi:hypothetical protein